MAPPESPNDFATWWDNKEALFQRGMELTQNHTGYTYHRFGAAEKQWLSSLTESSLRLLDIGACYGVQTTYGLNSGRDVVALDMCAEHITVLRDRVSKLQGPDIGNLVQTIIVELPDEHVDEASVARILCSEVLHFHQPGQLRPQLKHFFKWLAPDGKLVVSTAAWPNFSAHWEAKGFKCWRGRSAKQVLEMLKTVSPSELVEAAPGMAFCPDQRPLKQLLGDTVYF